MKQWKIGGAFVAVFLVVYYLPLSDGKVTSAIIEAFKMLQSYARNHTLACVLPALFIAGAITTFLSKAAVLRYLGPGANKLGAYTLASVSGTVLAVCSCTVLPMFAGIYRVGAGLGPASSFLYAGPAINILALFLTARVLGFEIGIARAIGAIAFGFIIGLLMALIFRKDEQTRTAAAAMQLPPTEEPRRKLWQTGLYFLCMVAFLVFGTWYNPGNVVVHCQDGTVMRGVLLQEMREEVMVQLDEPAGKWSAGDKVFMAKADVASIDVADTWVIRIHRVRWYFAGAMGVAVLLMAWRWFDRSELAEWMHNTWDFAKMLLPLLFGGVFIVGFIGALLPDKAVAAWVGDNSLKSNLIASVVGCLFYFATLTEIPILEALTKHGMASGPALAMLLAGPALSLPSLLVIRTVIGNRKTAAFATLTVVMATVAGMVYGSIMAGT